MQTQTDIFSNVIGVVLVILFIVGLYYMKYALAWFDGVMVKSIKKNLQMDFSVALSKDEPPKVIVSREIKLYIGGRIGFTLTHIGVKVRIIMDDGQIHDSYFKLTPFLNIEKKNEYVVHLEEKNIVKLENDIQKRYNELYERNIKDILIVPYVNVYTIGKVVIEPK